MILYKREISAVLTLLILDIVWIYFFMSKEYTVMIPKIQRNAIKFNIYSAIGAYLLMVYLLIQVVLKYNMSLVETFLFGFSLYGVYDLTCGAVFSKWNFKLALIDMLWGGFVYTAAVYVSKSIK